MESQVFKHLCTLVAVLKTVPIKLHPHDQLITRIKTPNKYSCKLCLFIFLSMNFVTQFFLSRDTTALDKVVNGIFLGILLCCMSQVLVCAAKIDEMVLLLNSNFRFEYLHCDKTRIKKPLPLRDKINLVFVWCIIFSALTYPTVFVYGFHWKNPCKPSLVGYWLIEECYSDRYKSYQFKEMWNIFTKFSVLTMNQWMWTYALHTTAFCSCVFLTLAVSTIRSFIERYQHICAFNRSANNFDKLAIYRYIQLLVDLNNEILQKSVMPVLITGTTLVMGFSLATVVHTPWTLENILVLLLTFAEYMDCFLFQIFCLGGMAGVYKASKVAFLNLKCQCGNISAVRNRMWMRRFLKSCTVAKVKFGGNNFVEELTPLNTVGWAINISVQVLLFHRNRV